MCVCEGGGGRGRGEMGEGEGGQVDGQVGWGSEWKSHTYSSNIDLI